ncbi:MAG: thiamine pyrophosphate-binding protein [Elusimicrobia bacterium]|nr:thiamine pyrophosphate-binding protein [Elusimicrobiota bacterium]
MTETRTDLPTAVQVLVRYLEGEGVGHIFGIPGGPLMPLYEALFERATIRPVLSKHEEGAAFMADGYARVRRGLGVCCVTTGPGATNALTGVACACADSTPVLILSALVATSHFGKGAAQESTPFGIDLVDLYKPVTKASVMLSNPEKIAETVRFALRTAMSGRTGPVHLSLPADFMKRKVPLDAVSPGRYRASPESFDRASVREAARRLVRARRPAMLLGHGVDLSGAFEAARRLAERLCIPVATSPKGKGVFPEDHLLSLGVFGFAGSPQAEAYFLSGETDVLITVGTSLGELSTNSWDARLRPKDALIQIDSDPHEMGKNYPAHLPVVGDAKTVLTELLFQVERELRWQDPGSAPMREMDRLRDFKAEHPRCLNAGALEDDSLPLKPQRAVRELREALPHDAIVFVDIGNVMAWMLHYFPVYEPGSFHINLGLASMGHAGPASIGGQLAAPERTVIAVIGDAAFAMNGMEIHTAVENDLPVVWVVLNNGGLGMVHHGERLQFGGKFSTSKFSRPIDVAGVASSLGAAVARVEKPGELAEVMTRVLKARRPAVVEVMVDMEAAPPMGSRIEALNKFFDQTATTVPGVVREVLAGER